MKAQTTAPDQGPGSGRPRDAQIDAAALRAAAELLVEVGYAGLSLAAIAERAGTTRPALYRRWPSLAHLVHEAAFPDELTAPLPSTGTLGGDIRMLVAGALAVFSDPVARAAAPGLVAAITADPNLHGALLERFTRGVWGGVRERLLTAVETGEASYACDPDTLLDVIGGAAFFALLIHPEDLGEAWVDQVAHLITKGMAR